MMIRICLLPAALTVMGLSPATAQFQDPPPREGRSYEFHMTPAQLRTCVVADYERAQLLEWIAQREQDLEYAQQQLMREWPTREDYARVRGNYNAVRASYDELIFQENTLVEVLNNDCRKPYYADDYQLLKEELGFGWTSRERQGY